LRAASIERLASGSRIQRFELIDTRTALLDLVSKPFDPKQPDTRFLGVAEMDRDGRFVTPWVYLMNPWGGEHIEGSAMITFHIAHHDSEILRIIGKWHDEEASYAFDSNLQRLP